MKLIFSMVLVAILFTACKTDMGSDNAANEAFEANSKTVLANLEGWQNENLDYSMYANDFAFLDTGFGAEKDSISLDEMMANDKRMWDYYDFKLLTDPPVLLPGVNQDTRLPDGSVRHYSQWEVTRPATDSTEAKTGIFKLYESFDFDAEGKIRYQQVYGDFTGIMMHLNSME